MPTFKAPADFKLPEGINQGDEFEAMGTFVLQADGTMILKAVEGNTIEGYEDKPGKQDNEFMTRFKQKTGEPPAMPMEGTQKGY